LASIKNKLGVFKVSILKNSIIGILIGMLIINPVYSQTQRENVISIYKDYGDMTYKSILLQSSKEVKKREHKEIISEALLVIKKNPALGNIKIDQAINSVSFFFLNHLEKDFIAYPNAYSFYKGFRSVFRGMNIHNYNKKCVYRRGRGGPFTLIDFLNGNINCGVPRGYPRGVNKYKVIEEIDNSLGMLKKISSNKIDSYSAGKSIATIFSNLLIPNAHALSKKAKTGLGIGSMVAIVVGVTLIAVGFLFTPTAGIGIPVIAGGAALLSAGLGYQVGDSIHTRVKKYKKTKKERKVREARVKKEKLLRRERDKRERESMINKEKADGARMANTNFQCVYSLYSKENQLKRSFDASFRGSKVKACEMVQAKCNRAKPSVSFECLLGKKAFPTCTYQLITKKKKKVKATFRYGNEDRKWACEMARIECEKNEKWGRKCVKVKK